jgi:PAS domain S-box-containing protein
VRADLSFAAATHSQIICEAVLKTVPALVTVLDAAGRIVRFNQACEQLTGYTEAEATGRCVWDFLIPAEQVADVHALFDSLAAGRFPSTYRNDWITKAGERCPIDWTNSAVISETGTVEFVIGTGIDLRRQLRLEALAEALRASDARHAGIVSLAADAIISIDAEQRIILFNEGAEEIFGWPAGEIMGQPLNVLIPERFRGVHHGTHIPGFAAPPVTARRTGERGEIFGLRRSGEGFPAEASISKQNVGGQEIYTVILRDVTEHRRLEAAQRFLLEAGLVLSSSLDYATTLRQVAHLAVQQLADFCIIDIVSAEGSTQRLEAAHRDPAHGELAQRFRELRIEHDGPHLAAAALHDRRSHLASAVTPEDLDALAQDATHRALLAALAPASYMAVPLLVRDALLGVLVLVSTARAYTEDDLGVAEELARRAALAIDDAHLYDEARSAIHARDEVVAIVAHDLGNPISAIRIGTSLLLGELGDVPADGAARRHLAAIRSSTEQMERLIANLLDLRRIDSGRLVVDRRPCSPASIVESLRPGFELLADERGIAFECVRGEAAPDEIYCDPDRLRQVLQNLVGNAFKFTRRGGTVSLTVAADGNDALFEVRDDGRGIETAQIPHLFDRFWQAERSGRRSIGLGLSIVKGIVDAHGGQIRVESQLRRGTSISISIPVRGSVAASPAVVLQP